MVGFVQAGRIDDVRCLYRVDEVEDCNASRLQTSQVGYDMELRYLAARHVQYLRQLTRLSDGFRS